jgi:hypothetical protein
MLHQPERSKSLIINVLFIVLAFSSFAFAQRQTGTIEGSVQDVNGLNIPGAIITASSPSLIGGSTIVVTDEKGFYRFPFLPSGIYEVKAELGNFQTQIRPNVVLSVGFTQTVNFRLAMTGVSELVEVVANPPLIDVSTTAVSFTIPRTVIENLPKTDNIENLMALTPGVSDNLGFDRGEIVNLMAYGAAGEVANSVWIDGVNVSNPNSGDLTMGYNQNWIDEVYVTGIGAPAEYGGFTGVVANYTTRSGGNQFHGLFDTFFQNQNLTWSNVPNPNPEKPFTTYDVSAQLGGPIVKDKLWFFSGIQFPHTETPTAGTESVTTDTFRKLITKATYQWNRNNTLQGFGTWNDQSNEREGSTPTSLEEANHIKSENPQWSWNATWISLLGTQTNFEGRLGGTNDHFKHIEEDPDVSGHYDLGTGISSVNNVERTDYKRSRLQMNSALSHHADSYIQGSHDFRFGVQYERSNIVSRDHINGNYIYYDYFGAPYDRFFFNGYLLEASNHQTSTYVQDDWKIADRLTLSLGVRWDHNRGFGDKGLVYATDPVAPRLGFVWLLDQENQTVIKAHFGDYYEALLTRLYGISGYIAPYIYQKYINGEWVDIDTVGGGFYRQGGGNDLKHPYVRQFTVGIDRVLSWDIPFGAHYIYRRWGNLMEDIGQDVWEPVPFMNPLSGETMTVYRFVSEGEPPIFTNPPGLYRRYDGVELFANKHFANKLYLSGSFVFSKLTGNFYGNIFGGTRTFFLNDPNETINRDGRLENDRTVSWKVTGTYELPWGFNTGFFFRHESGGAWTATLRLPFEISNNCCSRILLEPLGSRRISSRNILDLRVEKAFQFYNGQLRLTADIFNVFNSAHPLGVDSNYESPFFGVPGGFTQPRRMRIGLRYTF